MSIKVIVATVQAICISPVLAAPCEAPPMIEQSASPAEVRRFFSSKEWQVVTFLGYSGAGYENNSEMLAQADRILQRLSPDKTIVNIGATAEGIGAVYERAKARGLRTSGIVSSIAKGEVALSPCVDYVFYVPDETWGGYDKNGKLSPTSEAMLAVSDELIAIGGGDIARDELVEARKRGKPVTFIPADMNHEKARKKAKGDKPVNFQGSASEAMWADNQK